MNTKQSIDHKGTLEGHYSCQRLCRKEQAVGHVFFFSFSFLKCQELVYVCLPNEWKLEERNSLSEQILFLTRGAHRMFTTALHLP